jgi:hypothetical protein
MVITLYSRDEGRRNRAFEILKVIKGPFISLGNRGGGG